MNRPTDDIPNPAYSLPDRSSVAERFTTGWMFERALTQLKMGQVVKVAVPNEAS
jgi:hypothetical protein